ncbi:MAG: 5-dehydro-4-deoxy-D-glucuronate isomerase [Anaerolineae bacterium]|nr:5-dehydro-4-deoxy-D-glucuronate isomerase [Anaerolineae bacterium]
MEVRYAPDPSRFERMNTAEIRQHFLIEDLFGPGQIKLVYWHTDRLIIGSVTPTNAPLALEAGRELAAAYFAERREIGVINIGGEGQITVDGVTYNLGKKDTLYIGRGSRQIEFSSLAATSPASFYLISLPAHQTYPTQLARAEAVEAVALGSPAEANQRRLYKVIHPEGIQSCQLVMGFTQLAEGSIWNTMPAHTHERRSEVYLYFDLATDAVVFHLLGQPTETRHLVVRNGQAALSPSWSIHSGAGTKNYTFVWAMGGENQAFSDMDAVKMEGLA